MFYYQRLCENVLRQHIYRIVLSQRSSAILCELQTINKVNLLVANLWHYGHIDSSTVYLWENLIKQ